MNIRILAGTTSKFGELWNVSPRDLAKKVVYEAIRQAGIRKERIEAVFVGNMLSSSLGGQDHLGAFFSEELNIEGATMKIEGACASGGLAVHAAVMSILSGLYGNVLVLGIEKMTDHKPEEVAKALMGAGSDEEREAGATFPALYALMARAHMQKYKTTQEDMANVSVKNHFHATLNSNAQFPFKITVDQVLESPVVSSPLKLLDCSPISDGAACLILSGDNKKKSKYGKIQGVDIVASCVERDSLGLSQRSSLVSLQASVKASAKAYKMAGVSPKDVDLAEVHDCFSIAEIMAMEDLSFFKRGEAVSALSAYSTQLGSIKRPIINTSGGLKASGHPVGATGVKQIVEVYRQLMHTEGKKQVYNAKIGLSHNVGGSGATAVVHILKRINKK